MALRKQIKYVVLNNAVMTYLAYLLFNLYFKTLRVRVEDLNGLKDYFNSGGNIVFSSWHQRFFGGLLAPRILKKKFCVMISRSRDGDFASRVARFFGWVAVRGSSSRGGREALRQLLDRVSEGYVAGHIVDGPTGPPRVVKPGLISLAQKTGIPIAPVYVIYENCWEFNSWDRFQVPKPFTGIYMKLGERIAVPEKLTDEEFEAMRRSVEEKMIEGYASLEEYWKETAA